MNKTLVFTATYNESKNIAQLIEKILNLNLNLDILILDVMMPGQNGYELTKEIKNGIKVPIILLTAKGEVENRIKNKTGIFDLFVRKQEVNDTLSKAMVWAIDEEEYELCTRIKNLEDFLAKQIMF